MTTLNFPPTISAKTKICLIVGDPIEHSLSPKMHNAGYQALGIADKFVFLAAQVKSELIAEVVQSVRVLGIHGLTCTMPHKLEVIKYLDWLDPVAKTIGAVNTVVNDNGVLKGYNTDWLGTVNALEKITNLQTKKVALIGAGGAARAMVYGLVTRGAELKIYNRTISKARDLATEFGCLAASLGELEEVRDFDIIINSTSLGMNPTDESPINQKIIQPHHICFDAVYSPMNTKFLQIAKQNGAKIVHGIEMLLYQGTAQFTYYTNQPAPEDIMRQVLLGKY